ncbi:hypothetical protein STCU_11120 [Strigomonas culicis]|uniref:Membrane-associated protein n=1 Tax=Strigomonas culicis TaxID=28005 RepID=S9TEZ5_9TRYP|nr:hypothetical protein STCU_11120 [Strigomonas culicis]|eukprot:EPY16592.1 hypothetical protein STCU_11120 [Strigomonas culicis]
MSPFTKEALLMRRCKGGLVVLLACLLAAAVADAAVQLTPTLPVLDVPFLAVPGLSAGDTLFASNSSHCSYTVVTCTMGGNAATNYDNNTCVFTVRSTDIGLSAVNARAEDVPLLYWCSSASSSYIDTFVISKITPTPPYAFLGEAETMTFNNATPITSQFGFYSTPCENIISGTEVLAIDSSRTLSVTLKTGSFAVLCGKIPSVSGRTSLISVAGISIASHYTASPTSGLRYTSVTFTGNTYYTYMSLSVSANCVPLAQEATTVTSSSDTVTSLVIAAPRGTYYVCGKNLIASQWGSFIPSDNTFEVREYGIQPHTLYLNLTTAMTMTMDANVSGKTFEAALFSDDACATAVTEWSTAPSWTVALTGTYYACIRQSGDASSMARSAAVRVVQRPSVTFSRSPAVRGLALGVDVSRPLLTGVITVGLSASSDCATLVATGATNLTGSTADLQVPASAAATMYYCVSTPNLSDAAANAASAAPEAELDAGYFYAFGTITTRAYSLGYPPLRTNTALTITLDGSITFSAGSRMRLLPEADGCDGTRPRTTRTTLR